MKNKYAVDEEWWRPHNLREAFWKYLGCPVVGHDKLTKFDGTVLCRRHQ